MVWISLQDDVKKSFEKVKDEILALKRSANRELLSIEELGNSLQTVVAKDEFYSFVKRLGERLDRMEESLELYHGFEEDIKAVDAKVNGLGRKVSRHEDLGSEIKEVRVLKGKVEAIDGSKVNSQEFNSAFGKLSSDISSVRGSMLTGKALDSLKEKLADYEKRVESLEKSVPAKSDVLGNANDIEWLRESVGKLESASQKRIDAVSGGLREDIEGLRAACVEKGVFEKSLKEMRKEAASIRGVLECSVSEVDFSDYVTRKDLGKKLMAIEDLKSEIGKVAGNASEIRDGLESLKKGAASINDVERVCADVKGIMKSLDSLKGAMEKAADSSQKRFLQEIEQAKSRFDKGLSTMKNDFEGKLEKVARNKAQKGDGVISRVVRGFSDFFKDENGDYGKQEKKVKPAPSVSELLKDDENKKKKNDFGFGGFVMLAFAIAVVIAGAFVVFWLANRPAGIDDGIADKGLSQVDDARNGQAIMGESNESLNLVPDESGVIEGKNGSQTVEGASEKNTAAIGTEEYCIQEYDCKARGDGSYWFGCYIDEEKSCRCFVTDAEGCGIEDEPSEKTEESRKDGGIEGSFVYVMAAAIVLLLFLALYVPVLKRGKKGDKTQANKEKEAEDGDGVNLEEFFHKK